MENYTKCTYYDVLRRKHPNLFTFISNDLDFIRNKGLSGPFSSTDDYSDNFEHYFNNSIQKIENDAINHMVKNEKISFELAKEQFLSFKNGNQYKHMINQLNYYSHADYLSVTNFELFGKKTFFFDNNLVEQLAFTDLNTLSEYVMLPFNSCLFVFNSELMIKSFHQILKIEDLDIDYKTPISIFINSLDSNEGLRTIVFACWHANHTQNYGFIKRQLLIKENWSILDMLKTDWSEIYKNEKQDFYDEKVFYNEGLLFFRVLINSILYLSSSDVDIINVMSTKKDFDNEKQLKLSKKKRDEIKKENKKNTELNYSEVGRNIGKIIINKSLEKNNINGISANHSINKYIKFMVRGHWRNQPYGKDLGNRKMIWIKPYFKGEDMGEIINKIYEVK